MISFENNLQHTLISSVGILASPSGLLQFSSQTGTNKRYHDVYYSFYMPSYIITLTINALTLYPPRQTEQFFPNRQIKTLCLCTIYHLKANDQRIRELTSAAMKQLDILREIALKCKTKQLKSLLC